jgi:hypothetical protein
MKKDERIELSEAQQNPYLARPEDFAVSGTGVPAHGQHGVTEHGKRKLLRQVDAHGKPPLTGAGQALNPPVERHGAPHTRGFQKKSR